VKSSGVRSDRLEGFDDEVSNNKNQPFSSHSGRLGHVNLDSGYQLMCDTERRSNLHRGLNMLILFGMLLLLLKRYNVQSLEASIDAV